MDTASHASKAVAGDKRHQAQSAAGGKVKRGSTARQLSFSPYAPTARAAPAELATESTEPPASSHAIADEVAVGAEGTANADLLTIHSDEEAWDGALEDDADGDRL